MHKIKPFFLPDTNKTFKHAYNEECFPGVTVVKYPPANAGGTAEAGSIPGSGRSPGVGNGNPFQDSCQENPMDRRDCQATGHSVAKSRNNLATKQQIIRNNPDTKNVSLLRINLDINAETLVNL